MDVEKVKKRNRRVKSEIGYWDETELPRFYPVVHIRTHQILYWCDPRNNAALYKSVTIDDDDACTYYESTPDAVADVVSWHGCADGCYA